MNNYLFSEMVLGHRDHKLPSFNTKVTTKTEDSIMFLANGQFVKLTNKIEDDKNGTKYIVKDFNTEAYRPSECPDLTFTYIQVRKFISLDEADHQLDLTDPQYRVKAKGILVGNLLLSIPNGLLMEEI